MSFEKSFEVRPRLLVFAGPNGSGKSTVTKGLPIVGIYVNADDIKRISGCTDLEAAQEAEKIRQILLEKKQDFTFETVMSTDRNLELLRPFNGHLYCLVTVSDQNVDELAEIPNQLAELQPDAVTMGPLIYLNGKEIENFRRYSREHFGCDCLELEGWRRDEDRDYLERLSHGVAELNRRSYCVPASFTPHTRQRACCRQPWKRIHVRYDGEVGFCTDFFSFNAGNLREKRLVEIFRGERAELFREAVKNGCLSICDHCPWRLQ